ncbi:MAG TPA: KEOPS complex kinase/ATPase Bud32 [Candidatus Nanoarchaeia archaeon]|nr:KEOPS complex kinase/ATPase Bud32 [Candidatus Nanoarchaeia archaeon]
MKLAQGAEAIITKTDDSIIKHRFEKKYRHPLLDKKLRTARTRHEAKILKKLEQLKFPAPKIKKVDEGAGKIEMQWLPGQLVRNQLEKNEKIASHIGTCIAQLHTNDIIHGDLTTSNMIWDKKLFLIDFGLSFISLKVEDKAVDLHVFEEALEASHHTVYSKVWKDICAAYKKKYKDAQLVLNRLEQVRKRGRNKAKY